MSNEKNNENQPTGGRSLGGGNTAPEPIPESWMHRTHQPRVGRIGAWSNSGSGTSAGSRISGLHDLSSRTNVPSVGSNGDSEDEAGQPQSFFAGGERSGISVEGPAQGDGGNLVRDILRKAAQGTQARSSSDPPGRSDSIFAGGGYTLGSDDIPSAYTPDLNSAEKDEETEETAVRNITFWRDGFSVEDGPLLRYNVPENERLLNEINAGHAPPAILNVRVGQPVELRVARRTNEDYVPPPKRPMGAFEGQGQRLGSPAPVIAGSGASVSQRLPGEFPSAASSANASSSSEPRFEVDFAAPMTSIQVRLADGTRLVARMNLTHTVRDIRNFINSSRPGISSHPYTIGTTFPNKILDDENATIESASLKNSVIVQRLT